MNDAGFERDPRRLAPRSPRAALEPEYVPEPKRPSRRARHPLVIAGNAIFSIILLVGIAAAVVYQFGKSKFDAAGPLVSERVVNIPRGLGLREIADLLTRESVIDQPWVFIGGVLVLKAREDLKYGEYKFSKSITLRETIETIVEGKVVQHAFTIPEGLTSEQIVTRLAEVDFLAGNIREIPKEGTLLPETYNFPRGTTREQVIQRMQQAQKRALQEIWERRNTEVPVKSPEQLVTLASIVESEVRYDPDRPFIAAVYRNRLARGMRLEADPTVSYAYGRRLSRVWEKNLAVRSAYNTYLHAGLPPGPISQPGRASLAAALYPADVPFLFFVAQPDGKHIFSTTFAEHEAAIQRVKQLKRAARASRSPGR